MNLKGLIVALAMLGLVGCKKPVEVVVEPPATPAPEVAPPGRYWLRVKKSFTTDDGIVGYAPGTPLLETGPDEYVTDAGQSLQLAKEEVTNDLPEARKLVKSNAAARAIQARALAAAAGPSPEELAAAAAAAATEASSRETRRTALMQENQLLQAECTRLDQELSKFTSYKTSPNALKLKKQQDALRERMNVVLQQLAAQP